MAADADRRASICDSWPARALDRLTPPDRDRTSGVATAIGFGGLIAAYLSPWVGLPIAAVGAAVVLYAAFCPARTVVVDARGMMLDHWPPVDDGVGWLVLPFVKITSRASRTLSLDVHLLAPVVDGNTVCHAEAHTVFAPGVDDGIACPITLDPGQTVTGSLCFSVAAIEVRMFGDLDTDEAVLQLSDRVSPSGRKPMIDLPTGSKGAVVEV